MSARDSLKAEIAAAKSPAQLGALAIELETIASELRSRADAPRRQRGVCRWWCVVLYQVFIRYLSLTLEPIGCMLYPSKANTHTKGSHHESLHRSHTR